MPTVFILNGPNLNLLGVRDPSVYGHDTLADIEERCLARAAALDLQIEFRQTNHEGQLVDWIQEARESAEGVILNAGALTHTSVAVFDARAFGGQAGASARIENYLGFPTGISGQALTGRAYTQAQKFGADMLIPVSIRSLDCSQRDGAFALTTECGQSLRAKSIVVASGARYRRPEIENLDAFEGRGVWYWASPIEAKLCVGQDVVLVGGGNSAGQAAVFLSGHARKVYMIIRGGGLGASMSRYLIERIEAAPNIELIFNTEVIGVEGGGDGSLERVRWKSRLAPEQHSFDVRNLFLFVGADPATRWLDGCGVTLDRAGFVVTGAQSEQNQGRPVPTLETSVPGVFAVGDVRAGSVKRVGGAIGEGAQVVAALHGYLGDAAKPAL